MSDPSELLPIPKAKVGRKPKSRNRTRDPLANLELDLAKDPADLVLPCSEAQQADHLGWYVTEVRATNRDLGLYDKLPMVCKAEECPRSKACKTAPEFLFKGLRCPIETMEVYRDFVRYVRELEVEPDNWVDLKMIEELVQLDLYISRIDHSLRVDGFMVEQTAGIMQKIPLPVKDQGAHPLIAVQTKYRDDRRKLYKDLLANRAERQKLQDRQKKREFDMLDFVAKLQSAVKPRADGGLIIDATSLLPSLPAPDDETTLPDEEEEGVDPF
jgi:hypothetical protein